jgi:hypothetical protein
MKVGSKSLPTFPWRAWVARSRDQGRVVAYRASVREPPEEGKESGGKSRVILRDPEAKAILMF